MDTSDFEQIASSLTVKSICSPLGPDVPAGSTIEDVVGLVLSHPDSDPNLFQSRVIDSDGNVVGMHWWGNDAPTEVEEEAYTPPDTVVDEVMERMESNEFLSSATTILDAVELFGTKRNEYFYVIHVNEVVGILKYSDLFKPLGRGLLRCPRLLHI